MSPFISLYLTAVVIFFAIDMVWLGVVARSFYQKYIGYLLGDVKWSVAILFYLIFLLGLTYFVTYPLRDASLLHVAGTGAFFGFITYATYDLTNHATVRDWPWQVTVVDLMWGSVLGCLVSLCTVAAYRTYVG